MKTKGIILLLLLVIVTSLGLSACAKTDDEKVLDAVHAYIDALNREDIAAAQAATHRQAMNYFYLKDQLQMNFALYDTQVTLEKLDFVGITDGLATVDFVMTTIKTDQSDFKDNRVKGQFTLKKQDDQWKIFDTIYDPTTDIEFLTPQP